MDVKLEDLLQQGVAALQGGDLVEAERLYRSALQAQPNHPDANHNLGVLTAAAGKPEEALAFFERALGSNSEIEQFWVSYIDCLIREKRVDAAKKVLTEGRQTGMALAQFDLLEKQMPEPELRENLGSNEDPIFLDNERAAADKKIKKKNFESQNIVNDQPSKHQVDTLMSYIQCGQISAAKGLALSLTEEFPEHAFGWKALGITLKHNGIIPEALEASQKAVALSPLDAEAHNNLGILLQESGKLDEAEVSHRQAITLQPDYTEAYYNLGTTLQALIRQDEAVVCYEQVLTQRPDHAEAHYNLGIALQELNRFIEAEVSYRSALTLKPDHVEALVNIGFTLERLNKPDEAEASYRKALIIKPDHAGAHNNLGNALQKLGRLDEAEASHRQTIKLTPSYAEAYINLGNTLKAQGRLEEVPRCYAQAIALEPNLIKAHNNLGSILQQLGRFDEAEASYRRAVMLKPDYIGARDNLLFMLNYAPLLSAAELYREYAAYGAHVSSVTTRHFGHSGGLSVSGRRIRIGYSSPDFRGHACRFFMEPMFRAHDRDEFELFAYSNTAKPDGHTDRLKGYFDQWVDVTQLSDEAMAERIYADGIDILVDMAGHTKGNRLPVFAMRPAPIQVGSAIGYGYTTGLKEVDYFIGDENLTPEGSEPYFSETLWRVPAPAFVYVPPRDVTPEVSELPALRNGYVTFGSLTRTVRLNDPLLGVWKVILDRVPGSRLRLDQKPFAVEGTRELFWARLEGLGIARERVELTCSQLHWDAYEGIDITLDCWPHNAGTTTVESLWMGVPVLTKVDRPSVGCVGASYLRPLDLGAWVAEDEEAYIEKAVAYASDLTTLAQLRDCLRHRLEGSSLLDAVGGTQKMESAYRQMLQQSPNSSAKKTRQYQGNEPKKKQKFSLPIDRLKPAAVKSEKQNSENQKLSKRTPSKHQINTLLKYYESNKYNEAEIEAVLLTEEFPEHAFGWKVLGVLFKQRGRATDALDCMRKAAALSPDDAEIHNNLGVTLQALNRLDEAEASQRQAISLRPNYIEAHYNLGLTLQKLIRLSEAESSYKHAIKLQPSHAEAHNNVGVILQSQGVFDEAEASYRRAVILKPDYTEARDNLLYMQNYDPRLSAAELYREYAAYGAHVSSVTTRHFGHSGGLSVSGRRIRIGYSSPDFRGHACRFFMEPMFRAHDRDEFELFAYSNTAKPDGHTDRLKGYFDQWVDVTQLSDEAMAERIYADGIDILVDMAGHTKGNRLPVFAMRPAPIQVGSAIGYGYTTGLKEVDYFIGDENLTPEGSEPYFSETLWRVPAPAFVYVPPRDVTPEVSELPALRNGYVTFGSLTRTVRLNDPLLGVWKVILDRVPGSRLRLDQKPFAVEGTRELFWARLEGLGIARERVELTCSQLHWDAYEGIDITLDCWPHNAGTTTVESLWMGVPVLTKVDRPSVGCVGASYLRPLDLGAWVAEDEEAYIEKAVAYASDLTTLAQLRDCLRHRLEGSSLLDAVGGTQKMESAYRQMLQQSPNFGAKRIPQYQLDKLLSLYQAGQIDEARELASSLIVQFPEHPFVWKLLGVLFQQAGMITEALEANQEAVVWAPQDPEANYNLGVIFQELNRLKEAETCYRRAVLLDPYNALAHSNLGTILHDLDRFEEAVIAQRQATTIKPNFGEAQNNLGATLEAMGALGEAEASYRQAIISFPDYAEAHYNLAATLKQLGRFDEAEASYRRAVMLKPDSTETRDNLLYMQNYDPRLSAAELYREYAAYGAHVSSVTTRHFGHSGGLSVSGRRIRIGYSSPDFRDHVCRFFMEPMFRAHDRDEFELFAYSNTAKPDGHTDRLKGYFDQWVDVTQLSDEAMAERIYADGIDILVDMAGHTKGNRLPVFAMRPAPIQVGSAIGYGYTTGLKEVDYFIGDENLTPEGSEPYFSETLWRVPAPAFVYVPPRDVTPEVSELPALRNGYVTFGSLTRTVRLNDPLLGVWKVILDRVPGSRLRLDQKPFAVEGTRELFWARLEGLGIARERVELTCSQLHWDAYEGIDITLDCWPHNAGTTTVESLWMGVPVLTKVDRPSVGCVGASYLRPLDLGAWVAEDEEAYIEKAVAYASDLTTLAQLRDCLRHRLEGSSLLDAVGGTQKMESAYRQMVAKIGECKQ